MRANHNTEDHVHTDIQHVTLSNHNRSTALEFRRFVKFQ